MGRADPPKRRLGKNQTFAVAIIAEDFQFWPAAQVSPWLTPRLRHLTSGPHYLEVRALYREVTPAIELTVAITVTSM